jgi:hypothetical protein
MTWFRNGLPRAPGQVIFNAIISALGKYQIVDHSMGDMTIGAPLAR